MNRDQLKKLCEEFNNNKSKEKYTEILNQFDYYDNRPKCKCCGEDIYYNNIKLAVKKHIVIPSIYGYSFETVKNFDKHIYGLCICQKCLEQMFPDLIIFNPNKHNGVFNNNSTKQVKYAFNIPDDIHDRYSKNKNARTLESFISKYGEKEGKIRWDSYRNKQSITNTYEYKHEKYGMSKEEFDKFNKSRACTLENFILRYGEKEGKIRWDDYVFKEAYTNSLEYYISKYGKKDGTIKWNDYCKRRTKMHSFSKISQELFNNLSKLNEFKNHELYYGSLNHEYEILNKEDKKLFYLDFYDKTNNICIEFNGIRFHPKPGIYNENDTFIGLFKKTELVKDIWNREKSRIEYLKVKYGIKTIIVWEDDYRKNKSKIIENIINEYNNILYEK